MTVRQRGQPLIFLATILVLWIGFRIFAWTGGMSPETPLVIAAEAAPVALRPWGMPARIPSAHRSVGFGPPRVGATSQLALLRPVVPAVAARSVATALAPEPVGGEARALPPAVGQRRDAEVLPAKLGQPAVLLPPPGLILPVRAQQRRWSGDAWVLMRGGRGGLGGTGPGVATYGGSQVGAVLRYRLSPGNPHRPGAYLRASAALNGAGDREAALGLSVRPVSAIPVIIAAEGRLGILSGRTIARLAVMAVTEFPPVVLPGKARAEFYAQAGYVGGTGATLFADGQVRIDKRIVQVGPAELRAGGGAWGGAQRGAARFDVGPSVTLGIAGGGAAARLGLDWRFRVAGGAEPASGPALTVSAGF